MGRVQPVSRREVLAQACELAGEYGESLTLTAFRRETGLSQWAIFDLFGNWKNLRVAAGLTPEAPRVKNRITKERILELARPLAEEHGERLTEWLFLQETQLSGRMVANRFGSWGALRQALGLSRRAKVRRGHSQDELLDDLYQVWRRLGERPKYHQHRWRGGKFHASTIREAFGSWEVVLAAYAAHCRRIEKIPLPPLEGSPWREERGGGG
jgi:hypothetical protein